MQKINDFKNMMNEKYNKGKLGDKFHSLAAFDEFCKRNDIDNTQKAKKEISSYYDALTGK